MQLFVDSITGMLSWLVDALVYVLKFVLFFFFEGLFAIILALLNSLDLVSIVGNISGVWSMLPEQMVWFIHAVGISQGLSILGIAYFVRMTLNLIPSFLTRI